MGNIDRMEGGIDVGSVFDSSATTVMSSRISLATRSYVNGHRGSESIFGRVGSWSWEVVWASRPPEAKLKAKTTQHRDATA